MTGVEGNNYYISPLGTKILSSASRQAIFRKKIYIFLTVFYSTTIHIASDIVMYSVSKRYTLKIKKKRRTAEIIKIKFTFLEYRRS